MSRPVPGPAPRFARPLGRRVRAAYLAVALVAAATAHVSAAAAAVAPSLVDRQKHLFGQAALNVYGLTDSALPQSVREAALGKHVKVVVVDAGFVKTHDELGYRTIPTTIRGEGASSPYRAHGTAAASLITGLRDGHGIDGIAPDAWFGFASTAGLDTPANYAPETAIKEAVAEHGLGKGDVLVLELQVGIDAKRSVPVEVRQQVYDEVIRARSAGIIVVAAAGNDENYQGVNLDTYPGISTRPDSGAIIVGAGGPPAPACRPQPFPSRQRQSESGYGKRVNVQAPGTCSPAAGYLDLSTTGGAEYGYFNATSGATALVGGLVALLSSAFEAVEDEPLSPELARTALTRTGRPQRFENPANPQPIGPLPDLVAAFDYTIAPKLPGSLSPSSSGRVNTLAWGVATDNVGVHQIEIQRDGKPYAVLAGAARRFEDREVAPGRQYTYKVTARDAASRTSASLATQITTAGATPSDLTPPTAPTAVSVTPASGTAIGLTWSGATDNAGIARYEIHRDGRLLATRTASPFSDTGLKTGSYHRYSVVAVDTSGNRSTPSVPAASQTTGETYDVVAPVASGTPYATVLSRAVALDWTQAQASDDTRITHFDVQRRKGSGPLVLVAQVAGRTYQDWTVAANTAYTYVVSAVDESGNRTALTSVPATTGAIQPRSDAVAPTVPVIDVAAVNALKQPLISWTASSDATTPAYVVLRDGLYLATVNAGSGTSFTDTAAVVNRSATYAVVAYDGWGNFSATRGPAPVFASR